MKAIAIFWVTLTCIFGIKAQTTFDPSIDTIAVTDQRGIWKIMIAEKILVASAQLVSPNLSAVHDVRVQDIHGKPYLFLRGKHREKPEFGYTIMVQLNETQKGVWKAGNIYQGCWGETCSECGFDDYWGCACERYDGATDEPSVSYCNHMISLGMGLLKITIPD
jgi:hypothetical protein